MRLTLRTLLACLDRVLPPTEQAEIDAKVAGSTAAQQLVARIQRVVRQSDIPSPRLDGRGLAADANSVAEYLDNCLEHDRLETFERICLESDMHLAEVAACHEMLATLARDPGATAPLDAAGRRTLLAAMGHHSSAEQESERDEALATARAMRSARGVPMGAAATPSGRKSWSAWAAALAALALVVALVAVLVEVVARSGSRRGPGEPPVVALADPPAVAPAAPAAADAPAIAAATPATESPADPEVAPAAVPVPPVMPAEPPPPVVAPAAVAAPAVAPSAAVPVEAPAPAPATTPAPPAAPVAAAPRVPQGDALAIAAPSPPPAAAAVPAQVPPAGDPDREHESLGFVDAGGLLVHRVVEQGKPVWAALAPGATLGDREDLVVPFGSQPDVNVRGVTIRLLDGARAMITSGTDGTPWLELVFGRAIVRSSRRDARLGIKAGGIVGTITAGLTDPAAVSVDLERAPGADPDMDPVRVHAAVIAARGGLAWRQGDGTGGGLEGIVAEGMLDSGSAIEWSSHDPGVGRVVRLEQLPGWVGAPAPPDKLQRAAGEALAARAVAAAPLDQVLREMAADKRVENRVVAAATLALLGEFDACVELLCEESSGQRLEQRQWSKLEEEVVPLALARGANAAERLRRAFEDRGPHGKAETLFAMARGFSDAELAAGAAEALVTALDDADLVVRRYAYKCICDIVQPSAADRLRYRPDGLPELRREGAAWWRGQLQRGLIRRRGAA